MRLSVAIAAHNEGGSLWKTVRSSIEGLDVGQDYEIVVADDASDDGSVDEMRRRFPQVRVVRHAERRGASPTKDLGARDARGDVLVFLDGHTNPQPGAILQLVEDVERLEGRAIVTPTVEALDVGRWKNSAAQVGHGYRLELQRFECGWLPLSELAEVHEQGRTFYESPALIGCALAVGRELYEELRGFDPQMRFWGVEDLDFGLKCWLMGYSILHDPEAIVGHRFRESFDNYDVPIEHLVANQLRMARKNFTPSVWSNWLDACRSRYSHQPTEHPEQLWTEIWNRFEADRASVEQERAYLLAGRVRDEFSYAEQFGLIWPRLATTPMAPFDMAFEAMAAEPSPSPSPPPCGARVRFLENNNNEIGPGTQALNVSNYRTDVDLAANTAFDGTSPDQDNFRLEVEDASATGASVDVTLKAANRAAISYTLDKKSGNKFRGEFLRLVTDGADDAIQGTQTVLCELGETVVLTYSRPGETCEDKLTIQIGRPKTEDYNGPVQRGHDIREIGVRVYVFSRPGTVTLDGAISAAQTSIKVDSVADVRAGGTLRIENELITYDGINDWNEFTGCTRGAHGTTAAAHADNTNVRCSTRTPAVSRADVDHDLTIVDQRYAQSTVRVSHFDTDMGGPNDPGIDLPPAMLDGYVLRNGQHTLANLTEAEKAIVTYNDPIRLSIMYVDDWLVDIEDPPRQIEGIAYFESFNNTGSASYQGFVVISNRRGAYTLPHEILHVLLNSSHPRTPVDPDTALFHVPLSRTETVGATKRIGPFPGDGAGSNGTDDTHEIRETAENLP